MGCVLDVDVHEDVLRLSDEPAVVAREWPDAAASAHAAASAISGDVLAEVLQIIFCSLDCEGTRKLASVNKLFRTRSYSAVAVAEFRESQVQLLGFFQSYQVVALREGRLRAPGSGSKRAQHVADGRRAFVARVEDNRSLADLAGSVQVLSAFDAASKSEREWVSSSSSTETDSSVARREDPLVKCGTLKAHDISKGVRLPFNLSLSLRSSLTDRERRLLALGEAFQKKVLCTFRVGKQHGHSSCSVKCTQCSKYACAECHEAHRCSQCQKSYCADCWEQGICHEPVCSHCSQKQREIRCPTVGATKPNGRGAPCECALCPVYVRQHTCSSCALQPHCAACQRHCSTAPRACDSCGEKSCADCIEESPYCQLCGQFSLW